MSNILFDYYSDFDHIPSENDLSSVEEFSNALEKKS